MPRLKVFTSILAILALTVACSGQEFSYDDDDQAEESDHSHWHHISLDDAGAVAHEFLSGKAQFSPEDTDFRQVGLMIDGRLDDDLYYRVQTTDGRWSTERPLELTWSEGEKHVGRVLLDERAETIEITGGAHLDRLFIEFYEEAVANPDIRTSQLSLQSDSATDTDTIRQQVAPGSLVVSRSDWGARHPNKNCGFSHNPYRMTIHHTASPSNDGGDPAARMRQMQAFHIDSRGWCDIGYHFVVSQSGHVYQGRSSSQRSGAHVGGHNTGNVGISLIGNFNSQTPGQPQLDATVDIMNWVHETHAINLDSSHIKGHGQWPSQWTDCPGTNLRNKIPELMNRVASGDTGGGGQTEPQPDADVQLTSPGDGSVVPNPVAFEFEASAVSKVQFEVDGWPLSDPFDPQAQSPFTYEFVGTGFEREVVLYGYNASGTQVAKDTVHITVDDGSSTTPVQPDPTVEFVSPSDGTNVGNPVTFNVDAIDVDSVQIEVDDWPLSDPWDPQQQSDLTYDFVGTGFERKAVLYGYAEDGSQVSKDTIYFTVQN